MASPYEKLLAETFLNVHRATEDGALDWQETAEEDAFLATIGDGISAEIRRESSSSYDEQTYVMKLFRGEQLLVTIYPNELPYESLQPFHNKRPYVLLMEVWERARMNALKIDASLKIANALLNKLSLPRSPKEEKSDDDIPF